MQGGQQLGFGADISTAVGVEGQFIAATNQFVGQLQGTRLADDECVVFKHDGLNLRHLASYKIELVGHVGN